MFIYNFSHRFKGRAHGSRNVEESTQKAIVPGRNQARTHQELAQQFGLARMTVTNVLIIIIIIIFICSLEIGQLGKKTNKTRYEEGGMKTDMKP